MYDNIQESVDCPPKEIIEDDDMLDGLFIIQGKKREKEKLEQELDNQITNNKIKGSEEVFLMVNPEDKKQLERINNLNDPHSNMIKKQRMEVIKNSNDVIEHHKLPDQHLKLQSMANKQLKKQEYDMDKDYKKIRDAKYKQDSKDRLSKILKKKIQTTMIGGFEHHRRKFWIFMEQ